MPAISNTSPLILLEKVGCLWVLEKLFKRVLIPPAVDKEWLRPGGYTVPAWLSVAGTLGILVAAKQKNIITKLSPVLETLKHHRFYISDEVLQRALTLVNEA